MNVRVAGERFGFGVDASAKALPEAWRELDRAVHRWIIAHGGGEAAALAGGWASLAEGHGDTAWRFSRVDENGRAALTEDERKALEASPLVANAAIDPAPTRPFVRDGEYLYLLRNYRAEVAVAARLAQRRRSRTRPTAALSDDDLRVLFNGSWTEEEAQQRAAVVQGVGKKLLVLTGGPGTGKTTTVLRMLLGLARDHRARTGSLPQLRIAAPTGKAAQRLSQALRAGAQRLRTGERPIGEAWEPFLQAALAADAATVHRLLGSRGRHGGFGFHAGEPLPADIVVIDEASMLDLGLLRALLEALREDAVLILVGDADQLTSVGTGSIMMDIVNALEADPRDDLVRLTHCFRADVALVPVHVAVQSGDVEAFDRAIASAALTRVDGRPAAVVHAVGERAGLRPRIVDWTRRLQRALEAAQVHLPVAADASTLTARLDALRGQQLLCAMREGPFGAQQLGAAIAARLRAGWPALSEWEGRAWYPGRCVIVTRNDPAARLYNGDVGICIAVEEAGRTVLRIAFDAAADDALQAAASGETEQGVRLFDPITLPTHEDAFALTVHKSQGSEYAHVAVLLPPDPASPLLLRQLLYTALSRAKRSIELWSVPESVDKALTSPANRHGKLSERIGTPAGNRGTAPGG